MDQLQILQPAPNAITSSSNWNLWLTDSGQYPCRCIVCSSLTCCLRLHFICTLHLLYRSVFTYHSPNCAPCSQTVHPAFAYRLIQLFICSPFKWKSKKVPVKCLLPPELFKKILTHWCVIISDYFFTGTWTSFTFFQAMII